MNNHLLIQQATSLFDLLPCRTIELQIAGDWLEDRGLHSFIADVVRQGKWSLISGLTSIEDSSGKLHFQGFAPGGSGYGNGRGDGYGWGFATGSLMGDTRGYGGGGGNGAGLGIGDGCGTGFGDGTGDG